MLSHAIHDGNLVIVNSGFEADREDVAFWWKIFEQSILFIRYFRYGVHTEQFKYGSDRSDKSFKQ